MLLHLWYYVLSWDRIQEYLLIRCLALNYSVRDCQPVLSLQPLSKKIPENPKYKHVRATVDTGELFGQDINENKHRHILLIWNGMWYRIMSVCTFIRDKNIELKPVQMVLESSLVKLVGPDVYPSLTMASSSLMHRYLTCHYCNIHWALAITDNNNYITWKYNHYFYQWIPVLKHH